MKAALLLLTFSSLSFSSPIKLDAIKLGFCEYKNAEIVIIDQTRATIRHDEGVAKVLITDLPEGVRKSLGWKSPDEIAAEKMAVKETNYPQLLLKWGIEEDSDKKMNDELRKFLNSNPNAQVLCLTVHVSGKSQWFKKIIYDKQKKHLVVMTRTIPPKGTEQHYVLNYWKAVSLETLEKGIPWFDENFKPLGEKTRISVSPITVPIEFPDCPEITDWP
jgi:hypothetical protein